MPYRASPVEPPQRGERRVVVEGEGNTAYFTVVFHTPPPTDGDFHPLVVLDAVLSGASGMTLFGNGGTNKTSRLYRALVDTELAADVSGSLIPTVDPFVYSLTATVRTGRTPAEVEERLWAELERVAAEPIREEELRKGGEAAGGPGPACRGGGAGGAAAPGGGAAPPAQGRAGSTRRGPPWG